MRRHLQLLLFVCLFVPCCSRPATASKAVDASTLIQPLIDPAKLATLGDRGANQRIQKITAILWQAKKNGQDPAKVADGLGSPYRVGHLLIS